MKKVIREKIEEHLSDAKIAASEDNLSYAVDRLVQAIRLIADSLVDDE